MRGLRAPRQPRNPGYFIEREKTFNLSYIKMENAYKTHAGFWCVQQTGETASDSKFQTRRCACVLQGRDMDSEGSGTGIY
jgi:hypothetical protein